MFWGGLSDGDCGFWIAECGLKIQQSAKVISDCGVNLLEWWCNGVIKIAAYGWIHLRANAHLIVPLRLIFLSNPIVILDF